MHTSNLHTPAGIPLIRIVLQTADLHATADRLIYILLQAVDLHTTKRQLIFILLRTVNLNTAADS